MVLCAIIPRTPHLLGDVRQAHRNEQFGSVENGDAGSQPIVSQPGSCRPYWLVGGLVKNCMRRLDVMLDRSVRFSILGFWCIVIRRGGRL